MSITKAKQIRKLPDHVKTSIDRAEYIKDVLERQCVRLFETEASERIQQLAHAEFYAAYLRFADLVTRACEQGVL